LRKIRHSRINLLPIWQLDGSRGFRSLNRTQRWIVAAGAGTAFLVAQDAILAILAIMSALRAFSPGAPKEPDWMGTVEFVLLVLALGALTMIHVPVPEMFPA
jgi:Zn-dependent protease